MPDKNHTLNLLYSKYKIDFAKLMPRTFIISTNNGSSKLIFEVLKNTSFTIMPFVSNKLQKIK